jgi:hypothetical protein
MFFFRRIYHKAITKPRFAVELGALIVVLVYTISSCAQSCYLAHSVAQQVMIDRPVLLSDGMSTLQSKEGIPTKVRITFFNFGKTVALNATPFGHLEIGNTNKTAPRDANCSPDRIPPRDVYHSALAPYENGGFMFHEWASLAETDVTELKNNPTKIIYVVGCIYYEGLDHRRYYTDVCMTWTPNWPYAICGDTDRNFIR